MLAELPGATADWIVLGAHYDTKAGIVPFEGANDGLVSITSAKWGNFRGVLDGGFWSFLGGVNHLAEVGALTLVSPGYDAPTHFVNMASDLKYRGY